MTTTKIKPTIIIEHVGMEYNDGIPTAGSFYIKIVFTQEQSDRIILGDIVKIDGLEVVISKDWLLS